MAVAILFPGGLEGAEPLLRETFEAQREILGELHPDTANTFTDLLVVLRRLGKVEDPFGHAWSMSSRVREMTKDEVLQAAEQYLRQPS